MEPRGKHEFCDGDRLAATAVLGSLLFRGHLDALGWIGAGGALLAGALVTVVALGERLSWMQGAAILILVGSIALMPEPGMPLITVTSLWRT